MRERELSQEGTEENPGPVTPRSQEHLDICAICQNKTMDMLSKNAAHTKTKAAASGR